MLLLVLTSISVVVAARQKRNLKLQICECGISCKISNFGSKIITIEAKFKNHLIEDFGLKIEKQNFGFAYEGNRVSK